MVHDWKLLSYRDDIDDEEVTKPVDYNDSAFVGKAMQPQILLLASMLVVLAIDFGNIKYYC